MKTELQTKERLLLQHKKKLSFYKLNQAYHNTYYSGLKNWDKIKIIAQNLQQFIKAHIKH
jgi:hypothetical protein